MRRLLSHSKTKNELSNYLAEKFLDHAMKTNLRVFVAWGCQFRATHQNVNHLRSDQEEADTKMLLPALDATACQRCNRAVYPFSRHMCFSSTSKTLSGAVCKDILFSLVRVITIVWSALVQWLAPSAVLNVQHYQRFTHSTGLTSPDVSCWKTFMDAEEDTITALRNVGTTAHTPYEILALVEKFLCMLYQPGTGISHVKDLRWHICSE